MTPRLLKPQAGGPTLRRRHVALRPQDDVLFGDNARKHYKCRRAGGELWRLMEYRQIKTKRKNLVYRWVCVAIGTKALKEIAFRLNLLP